MPQSDKTKGRQEDVKMNILLLLPIIVIIRIYTAPLYLPFNPLPAFFHERQKYIYSCNLATTHVYNDDKDSTYDEEKKRNFIKKRVDKTAMSSFLVH